MANKDENTVYKCNFATTEHIELYGEQQLAEGKTDKSVVLVEHQNNAKDNGIYISGPTAWTRCPTSTQLQLTPISIEPAELQEGDLWLDEIQDQHKIFRDGQIVEISKEEAEELAARSKDEKR